MKKMAMLMTLLMLTGCASTNSSGLTEREAGALAGGGIGAGIGAIIGHQTGHAGAGTAIGAGAGALTGALAGEGIRRSKEQAKQEIREGLMQKQHQTGSAPQYGATPQYAQPQVAPQPVQQEVHTKYNPRTGETFPEQYQFDLKTGEALKYIK